MNHKHNLYPSDAIDKEQSEQMLNSLVSKAMQHVQPKSKYIDSFQTPKLPMSPKRSVYGDSYVNYTNLNQIQHKMQPEKRNLKMIIGDSSYQFAYRMKSAEKQLMSSGKRKDNLKIGGPSLKQSTYSQQYPPISTMPIKETLYINPQNLKPLGVKMTAASNYHDCFQQGKSIRAKIIKREGSLKVNGSFIGGSTYKQQFQNLGIQKSDSFSPKNIYRPSLSNVIPQSSYKDHYAPKSFPSHEILNNN